MIDKEKWGKFGFEKIDIQSEKTMGDSDVTFENNICHSCIHKTVCKFNTVCRTNTDDKCSAYEPENICYFCSKSNSCEVKDYPVSKCKQHYYNKKHRALNRTESEDYIRFNEPIQVELEPSEDCIARQPLIDNWNCCADMLMNEGDAEVVMGWIFDAPPVTPKPKTAHWVEENINEWSRKVFCSGCGYPPPFEHISNGDIYSAGGYGVNNKTKYCPNCGAKMESEDKYGKNEF